MKRLTCVRSLGSVTAWVPVFDVAYYRFLAKGVKDPMHSWVLPVLLK